MDSLVSPLPQMVNALGSQLSSGVSKLKQAITPSLDELNFSLNAPHMEASGLGEAELNRLDREGGVNEAFAGKSLPQIHNEGKQNRYSGMMKNFRKMFNVQDSNAMRDQRLALPAPSEDASLQNNILSAQEPSGLHGGLAEAQQAMLNGLQDTDKANKVADLQSKGTYHIGLGE